MTAIEIGRSEVIRQNNTGTPWAKMNLTQKKNLAAKILRNRNNSASNRIAFYVETNNPNFKNFAVINDIK